MASLNIHDIYREFGISVAIIIAVLSALWMKPDNTRAIFRFLSGGTRKNKLRSLLKGERLSSEGVARVKLELNQRNNMWLTGMLKPGIAEAAVILTTENNLRARYLSDWRVWLEERNGQILFDKKSYKKVFFINCAIGVFVGLLAAFLVFDMYYQWFYPEIERGVFPALINLFVLWLIIFMMARIPGKKATLQMKRYIERYNKQQRSKKRVLFGEM
ncbi:hypothetical protein RCV41_00560 [Escherichia coli]|nr:hypothetical protein [Escherichia coli]